MKTIGYAIVGTGYFGAELGRIMKEQEGAKIVAVLDPEMRRLWQKNWDVMWKQIWIPCTAVRMWTQ